MNTSSRLVLVMAAFAALVTGGLRAAVTVGQPAPDFALTDLSGQTRKLSDFRGRTVVLEWNNPDCPFVLKHYESDNLPKLQRAATADGVVWLMINSGAKGKQGADYTVAQIDARMKGYSAAPTAYLRDPDGKVGHLYAAKTTPQLFVVKADGTLVYNGAIDSIRSTEKGDIAKATNYVSAALAAVRAGQPVAKAVTTPYGCSVKY